VAGALPLLSFFFSGVGGDGGFGGGGGGTSTTSGTAGSGGFGGGDGTASDGMENTDGFGGGAGMGGAIFIQDGGELLIEDGLSFISSAITAGTGFRASSEASAFGTDIFMMSGGEITFQNLTSDVNIPNPIEGDQGAGGGSGGVFLLGSGNGSTVVTIRGENTYTTTTVTTINSGTLAIKETSGSEAGSVITDITVSGGGLEIETGAFIDTSINPSATVTLNGGTTLTALDAFTISDISIDLNGDSSMSVTNSNDQMQISSVISGSGALTKSGGGTLLLSAANTRTGGTTISAGTLALDASGTLGATPSSLQVNTNGTFLLQNGAGTKTITALTGSGTVQLNSGSTLEIPSGSFSGTLNGSGNIDKTGSGTFIFTGSSSNYSGTATISDTGSLRLSASLGTATIALGGGGLQN